MSGGCHPARTLYCVSNYLRHQASQSEKALLSQQLSDAMSRIAPCKEEVAEGKRESEAATQRLSSLAQRMTQESEGHQRAMEAALSSAIRLCVVAPTVNVHVADSRLKFRASITDASLRNFLTQDVLQKYTFLYHQVRKGGGLLLCLGLAVVRRLDSCVRCVTVRIIVCVFFF